MTNRTFYAISAIAAIGAGAILFLKFKESRLEPPRKSLWGKIGAVHIYIVDGSTVRKQNWDEAIEYTMGGHHYRYKWIPENEVWIDDGLTEEDIVPTVIHELYERELMKNRGLGYDEAHEMASKLELGVRQKTT